MAIREGAAGLHSDSRYVWMLNCGSHSNYKPWHNVWVGLAPFAPFQTSDDFHTGCVRETGQVSRQHSCRHRQIWTVLAKRCILGLHSHKVVLYHLIKCGANLFAKIFQPRPVSPDPAISPFSARVYPPEVFCTVLRLLSVWLPGLTSDPMVTERDRRELSPQSTNKWWIWVILFWPYSVHRVIPGKGSDKVVTTMHAQAKRIKPRKQIKSKPWKCPHTLSSL